MSKDWRHTWQYWGEERKQRSLKKDFDKWKLELEDVDETESVFLIINEWPINEDAEGSEVVSLHRTENAAWDELAEIAKEFDVDIRPDDTSFSTPPVVGRSIETYYIDERQFSE